MIEDVIGAGLPARKSACERYSPPEVWATHRHEPSHAQVDPSVDIWAIGLITFEVLTGHHASLPQQSAFEPTAAERSRYETALQSALDEVWLEPALKDVLTACLSQHPDQRPSAARLQGMWLDVEAAVPGTANAIIELEFLARWVVSAEYYVMSLADTLDRRKLTARRIDWLHPEQGPKCSPSKPQQIVM